MVITSVTIGIFAGAFSVAVMQGAISQRLDEALNNEIAHIEINQKDYRTNNDLSSYMDSTDAIIGKIRSLEEVEAVSARLMVIGMANTATKSTGVTINGIDPDQEKKVTGLYRELKPGTGAYLDEEGRSNQVYIGTDLAKTLNIIRYTINDDLLDSLPAFGFPEELVQKIKPFAGTRFKNEKAFDKQMKKVMTRKEIQKYGRTLKQKAQSFREGSKLTLTFVDRDNYYTGGMFRVSGLYDVPNNMFESAQVFVREQDLRRLTGLEKGEDHMILVRLKDRQTTEAMTEKLREMFPGLEVMNWKDIQPDLAMMEDMARVMYGAFMLIILLALAFGIVNTMLMVVLERTKELGMLTAIGMNKKKVFRMILTESVFLSLIGGGIGMVLSRIIIALTARNGINFAGYQEGFEAMGYSAHIYPYIGTDFFIIVTLMIILTGILSAVYPALKALKLDPADALRTE